MNITDPIRRFARLRPNVVAVIRGSGAAVSYRDFDRMIDASAARMMALGLRAGQTVGLVPGGREGLRFLVLTLAMARIGIASAVPNLPDAALDACLVPPGLEPRPGVRTIPIDDAWEQVLPAGRVVAAAPMQQDTSAICRIFSSSGTTGQPKFAGISHDLLFRRIASNLVSMGPLPTVHLCAVGYGITLGFTSILRALWCGRTLVMADPQQVMTAIRRYQVASMVVAPTSLQSIVSAIPDGEGPPPSLRIVEVAGSLLPPRLGEQARQKLCANIVNNFGSLETGTIASGPIGYFGEDHRIIGLIHIGVEVEAVDPDNDQPLAPGSEGVLRFRSGNTFGGYLGEKSLPHRIFHDGWYYSGDIGTVSADGVLRLTGRTSDVINSGGTKISPHVVEDVLLGVPGVTDAAAFGVPDAMGLNRVWAAIVAPTVVDVSVLNAVCSENLQGNAPDFIVQLSALPRNANGKVLREELVKLAVARGKGGQAIPVSSPVPAGNRA